MKTLFKRLDTVIDTLDKNNIQVYSLSFKYNKLNQKRLSKFLWDRKMPIYDFTIGARLSFTYRNIEFEVEVERV